MYTNTYTHACTHTHNLIQFSLTPSHLVMDPSHCENSSPRILPIVYHLHSLLPRGKNTNSWA